ncbi:MAG: hypothetical protein N3A59_03660, partial [Thermodesulfovibrionales bacterium]|nr:hypothetical protein [Thermodesulfovibrionales bacterium]
LWLDPIVGFAVSAFIIVWAYRLIRDTAKVLLDAEASEDIRNQVINVLEQDGDSKVIDLHIWLVGPQVYTLIATVVTHNAKQPDDYKSLLPQCLLISHPVIEVRQCMICKV